MGVQGRYSDQYSLAIVYQEMLTGTLPFRGRTTAQLATEHLHKAPNLDDLPASEKSVIARALSKKPSQRFGSCREMIDALIAAYDQPTTKRPTDREHGKSGRIKQIPVNDKRSPSRVNSKSSSLADARPTKSWEEANSDTHPSTEQREIVWLPPLNLNQDAIDPMSPALFIGFGGTGAEILTSLRSRLQASGMDLKGQADIGWLLVDTDEKTVQHPQMLVRTVGSNTSRFF